MPVLYVAGVSISENIKDIPEKTLNVINKCSVAVGEERKVSLKNYLWAGEMAQHFKALNTL